MGQQSFPFAPSGVRAVAVGPNPVSLTVTAAAQNFTLPSLASDNNSIMFTNIGTATAYFLIGSGLAVTTLIGVPILPNTQVTYSWAPGDTVISVIGSGTGSVLNAVAGQGT